MEKGLPPRVRAVTGQEGTSVQQVRCQQIALEVFLTSGGGAGQAAERGVVVSCGCCLQQSPQAVSVLCARSLSEGDSSFARARL